MKQLVITLLAVISCANIPLSANNIRQINTRNGLSNSAVIHLYQDRERSLWIGTYDGLNKYNGFDIQTFKSDINNQSGLSGNIIRRIIESEGDCLWIMTKGGLNKFLKKKEIVEAFFPEFQEDCTIACDSRGVFFILTQTGLLSYYDSAERKFKEIPVPNLETPAEWIGLRIDSRDRFWILNNGKIHEYALTRSGGNLQLEWLGWFEHPHRVTHLYSDRGDLFLIDVKNDLFVISRGEKVFIRNITQEVNEYGNISSVIFDGKDIVIGFWISGVVRLDHSKGYAAEKIPINCGVSSLLKDEAQDILWIGTDGQGLQAYTHEEYTFRGINLEELPLKTLRPVRAVFSDAHGDLWLGTKGDGIIRIYDYENAAEYSWGNVEYMSVDHGLNHSSVLTFAMGRANNVLWIGTGGMGVNYYSYDDNRIHTLRNTGDSFTEVQSILETSENTLWVSSKYTLFKIDVWRNGNALEVRDMQRYEFNIKNRQIFNNIYDIIPENDSIMWLAMRGNGAIRFNNRNGNYRLVTFDENGIAPMNDILCIHTDRNGNLWFGSSYGINKMTGREDGSYRFRNYNGNDGLPDNTVHGILESADGDLWLSGNKGLTLFRQDNGSFRHFNRDSGLKVIEFSDNAFYKDEKSSRYFFGGTDGVVWVERGEKKEVQFEPSIYFSKLYLLNEKYDIDDFLVGKGDKKILRLKHNQNFFTVSFHVNDFLEGTSKKFSYILENFNEVWMNTGIREAQFTNIPPGRYMLRVRYGNESEEGSRTANLEVRILAPWYFSIYAKVLYFFIAVGLLFLIYYYIARRYEMKRIKLANELSRQYKEEMYENKLRFFTNITHEFCTPLTLIQTPSKRILNYGGSDDYIRKYARIIQSNSERLNTLIQEIIDFRRMETGNKTIKIERCDIGRICSEIMEAFTDLAEENNIDFRIDTGNVTIWNSDTGCLTTILNNLVSNAFKYTRPNGYINVTFRMEDDGLVFEVCNSGEGIGEEDIPYVFSRYTVLDNVKHNPLKGLSSRNGLGLSICKSMVGLLGGDIGVESRVDEYARFIVRLPVLELPSRTITIQAGQEQGPSESSAASDADKTPALSTAHKNAPKEDGLSASPDMRQKVLIVDDNEDILWMLQEILIKDYIIFTAKDGVEGLALIADHMPDIVVTDIMMPKQDGISMIKQIKLNPHTMHIPIIIMSAMSANEDKIEGMESGADAYITKPFDEQYLKTIVRELIKRHSKLREYYSSSASAYDYLNGKLLSTELRDFIRQVLQVIDDNIDVVEFSPEDLADNMRISLRTLYRRCKESGLPAPKDLINHQRIEYSARLLVSTHQTIQEIIYAAGFTTRSHFYKEFAQRYGKSPTEYRASGIPGIPDLPDILR